MIYLILIGAQIYSKFLATSGLPNLFVQMVVDSGINHTLVLIGFVFMFILLGCILDSTSMMLITLPVLFPIALAFNWDPVWFGIVVIMAIEAGLLTPPLGINVFVVSAASGVNVMKVFKSSAVLFCTVLVALALVIAFPAIATSLPSMMKM